MLTGIVKATRAHYAALQHRPSPDRIPLDYEVVGHTRGTVQVKAPNSARRRMEVTKLINRLRSMYPEAHIESVRVTWRARTHYQTGRGTLCSLDNDASIRTATADRSTVTCPRCKELLRINSRPKDCACGATYDDQSHKLWCTHG